jgi:tRNA threonylcarbamoyladenosine biosynthesis protein TsaE
MLDLYAASLTDTHAVAAAVAAVAAPGDVIVLAGDMGAGKTAFAQGFARALGSHEPVTSPTFTLVHTYDTATVTLHHADLYRLDRMSEVADLALAELVDDDAVLLVEWGDVVSSMWGDHLAVALEAVDDDDARRIVVTGVGASWARRWDRVREAVAPWIVTDDGSAV